MKLRSKKKVLIIIAVLILIVAIGGIIKYQQIQSIRKDALVAIEKKYKEEFKIIQET